MITTAFHKPTQIFALIIIASLTAIIYSDINNHEFLHWDDIEYVVNNDFLRPLSFENIVTMFSTFDSANWHPVTWLSYAINFAIWGESAVAFKWTNVGIHLFNSILLFYITMIVIAKSNYPTMPLPVLLDLPKDKNYFLPAIFAAVIFAIHPQHVESVAWISDRKDLLCTAFYLMGVIAYFYSQDSTRKTFWNNLVIVLFLLALMSKSIAVTFPVLLMLIDIYPLQKISTKVSVRHNINILIKNKISLFLLAIIVASITLITQSGQIGTVEKADTTVILINSSINYLYYFFSILLPSYVSPYHVFPDIAIKPSAISIIPVTLMFGLFLGIWKLWKLGIKFPLYGFISYTIMILPAVGVVHVGHASRADRYAYLPTIIFYLLIGIALFEIYKRTVNKPILQWLAIISSISLIYYFSVEANSYTKNWKNDELVWLKVLEHYPNNSASAHLNLGNVYFRVGNYNKAIAHYQHSIATDSSTYGAHENLGVVYEKLGDQQLAIRHYEKMIEASPKVARPYTVLGDYYYKRNNYQKAEYYYKQALKIAPGYPNTLLRNGMIDFIKGDIEAAVEKIDYALSLDPVNIGALQLKLKIMITLGDYASAEELANSLLRMRPNDRIATDALTTIQNKTK